ncbi:MAG: hypothetical protein FWE23_07000 [Chitinivibrionia bacterium]|nr:hypothetical protein [Chitinivibrionia bacterium]
MIKKCIISTIIASLLFCKIAFAISVSEITPVHVSSEMLENIIAEIAVSIEPYASSWTSDWQHAVSKQEVEERIMSKLDELNSRVWADDLWTIYFLEALLWHYYYQLENEEGFFAADSIVRILKQDFPQRYQSFWLSGVNKIKAGRVGDGFRILDSLYVNAPVSSSFLEQYSKLSRLCFIPRNFGRTYNQSDISRGYFHFSQKERSPISSSWESREQDGRVSFIFTEEYRFAEFLSLAPPRLFPDKEPNLNIEIHEIFLQKIRNPLLWDPARAALHPARYQIIIDRNKQHLSLFEYLFEIVYGRFDYASEIRPPFHRDGISVRGGKFNVIRGVSGQSVVYTLFDSETFGNTEQFFTTPNTLKGAEPIKSRILITLETTQRMEPKALNLYIDIINGNFR